MQAVREINVPQEDVISQAILAIVDEVFKENGLDIRYSGVESTDALPLPRLPILWDALKAAKAQVAQQIDQLIAHLAGRWNTSCSINKLPVDVLVMIFKEFEFDLPHTGGSSRLLNLLLVCRAWYEAIMGSPNSGAPWIQKCPTTLHSSSSTNERDSSKLLELTIGNSRRIRSLDVRVSVCYTRDLWKLLEAPTPVLETLQIYGDLFTADLGATQGLGEFRLSEGMQIKNLSLIDAIIPLDSPRLSNLITLALQRTSILQSLELPLAVLSSSQRLEKLYILDKPETTEEYRANALVVLPHLRKLVLSDVPSLSAAAFLASVYTPSCCHVEVKDRIHASFEQASGAAKALDAAIWRPGNDQAAALFGGTDSNVILRTMSISIDSVWIVVEDLESFHGRRELRFARTDISELAARLGTTLSQLPSSPSVRLQYKSKYPEERPLLDLYLRANY
ncbi:hypothetical protein FS837_006008 [Tulasnella sp. UAMH 9824]|nr:hypothetical protein FS837_006008 [Tulasnella sp. UAMH 9824]